MHTLGTLSFFYLISFSASLIISAPGILIIKKFSRFTQNFTTLETISVSITFFLGFLNCVAFLAGKHLKNPKACLLFLGIFGLISTAMLMKKSRHYGLVTISRTIIIATFVGIWQFLPGLIKSSLHGAGITMLTQGNNDIANYAAGTTSFLSSGFDNNHHLLNIDLNKFDLESAYQGPNNLLAFLATTYHLKVWQVTTPAMTICISLAVIGLTRLFSTIRPSAGRIEGIIFASLAMMTSLMTYVEGHYFLGQVMAVGVSANIVANSIGIIKSSKIEIPKYIELSLLTLLSIYVYPHWLIPLILVSLTVALMYSLCYRNQHFFKHSGLSILSIAIGIALSFPYLPYAIKMLLYTSKAAAGWPLSPFNLLNLLLLPQYIGVPTPIAIEMLSWILILSLFVSLIIRNWRVATLEVRYGYIFITVSLAAVLCTIIFMKKHDFSSYDAWKLESYFLPLFFVIIVALFRTLNVSQFSKTILILIGLAPSLFLWLPVPGTYASKDLIAAAQSSLVNKSQRLNIDVAPNFETMATASLLSEPTLAMKSGGYWQTGDFTDACTFTYLGNPNYPFYRKINNTYELGSTEKSTCSDLTPALEPGSTVLFNKPSSLYLADGWSNSEIWGTWSNSKVASLNLILNTKGKEIAALTFYSNAFLSASHNQLNARIEINGKYIDTFSYNDSQNLSRREIRIPIKNGGSRRDRFSIQFVIDSPQSPKKLGISADPRLLGIGLRSIDFNN